jgi:hypothetical protein
LDMKPPLVEDHQTSSRSDENSVDCCYQTPIVDRKTGRNRTCHDHIIPLNDSPETSLAMLHNPPREGRCHNNMTTIQQLCMTMTTTTLLVLMLFMLLSRDVALDDCCVYDVLIVA